MSEQNYALRIAQALNLSEEQVRNTLDLLETGATIPFISRYRKEATGSLDEVQIGNIKDLYAKWLELDKRRSAILDSISEQGKLTPELREKIEQADSMSVLEDLYLPYRPKRKTRASVAVEKGLQPLAKILLSQRQLDLEREAARFVSEEKGVASAEDALARLRQTFLRYSRISTRLIPDKVDEDEKYRIYYKAEELLAKAPSHRILAMLRGEEEGILRVHIAPDEERTLADMKRRLIKNNSKGAQQVWMAATDAYKRLLQPQMETEMRKFYKEKADKEAISVFTKNARQLLLAAPLGQVTTLAIDPGFRTGCKVVILNPQGKLLYNETIYPHPPVAQYKLASDKLKRLVLQYQVDAIAIGNGTAGRETENFVRHIPFEREVKAFMVNESGASVYSASPVAREEFPNYDVTVRGAVSIGRRLMDPLAELVKIDPKSIGVGQYQHDVNQKMLQESLQATVESCVNYVAAFRGESLPAGGGLPAHPRSREPARRKRGAPRKLQGRRENGERLGLLRRGLDKKQGTAATDCVAELYDGDGRHAHVRGHHEGAGQTRPRPAHAVRDVRIRQECAHHPRPYRRHGAARHHHQHHELRMFRRYWRASGRTHPHQQTERPSHIRPVGGCAPQPESHGARGKC